MVLLGEARGVIIDEYNYYKSYPCRWPGFRRKLSIRPEKRMQFGKMRDDDIDRGKSRSPEPSVTL
jgi:hypothetical protein